MTEVRLTTVFSTWLDGLKDRQAQARIVVRIRRAEGGNLGQVRNLNEGVSEMKIDFGPGYRVYFTQRGETLVILLCGGDKRSQQADIAKAKQLAKEL